MSHALFSRNADLARLREDGYFVQVRGGFLILRDVPYVNAQREVKSGTLISSLTLAGDETRTPDTHVAFFDGDFPCDADGLPIQAISHQTSDQDLGHGLRARHSFSSKPAGGYTDYHHKMSTYATILSGPAEVLNTSVSPRALRAPEDEEESVFNYTETASGRAGIGALTQRFRKERIAIIGAGGTGSYILDLVSKTSVSEIRLFDGDEFLQHNAFRAPGAPSIEQLRDAPLKADYLLGVYSKMHRRITTHPALNPNNLELLDGITFAFLSIDDGQSKRAIVEKLETLGVRFIDVGMGLELVDGTLGGILRVTVSTPGNREQARERISFEGGGEKDVYSSNIQIADLNALNAVMAVVKWKKLIGFYRDLEGELHSTYTTDGNMLINEGGE